MTGPAVPPAPAPDPDRAARREYLLAVVLLAAGAGLLLLGYGRSWVVAVTAQAGLPHLTVDLAGRDVQPLGAALPVVALAGVAGVVATRSVGRVVAGAVLLLTGVAGVVLPLRFGLTWSSASGEGATIDRLVGEKVGIVVTSVPATATRWWLIAALGGLLVAVGGLLTLLHGRRWPGMGRRYEREQATGAAAAESAWDQLDRGLDPTVEAPPEPPAGPPAEPPAEPGPGEGAEHAGRDPDDPMLGPDAPA